MENKILQQEIENMDQKIMSYQMDLITLVSRHNTLTIQEKWIQKRSQELQDQLAEAVKQKAIYQEFQAS